MITLFEFVPTKKKQARVHLITKDVPTFWKGFYAIYKTAKGGWVKRWHQHDTGKVIKKAYAKISVEQAHKIDWLKYVNLFSN